MSTLKDLYAALGFTNVLTYVQSGNVIFDCHPADPAQIAHEIEAEIGQHFGYTLKVFVREPHQWRQIIAGNPFTSRKEIDLTKLHVTFLSQSPEKLSVDSLTIAADPGDEYRLFGLDSPRQFTALHPWHQSKLRQ